MYIIITLIIVELLLLITFMLIKNKNNSENFYSIDNSLNNTFNDSLNPSFNFNDLISFCTQIKNYIKNKYNNSEYSKLEMKQFGRFLKKFNEKKIYKSNNNKTYSINKGMLIMICTKYKTSSTAKYVIMHEMAHIINKSYGHNTSFWCIFKKIIKEAITAKIYEPINYKFNPEYYCGKLVQSNIIFTTLNCANH